MPNLGLTKANNAKTSAFTLIELMIAITLGMLIIYVAMAGFRTASQSVTMSNRMALENSLLRAGYFTATQDADWWLSWDDPDDQSPSKIDQPLRGYESALNRGLPFSPFGSVAFPNSGTLGTENERGWNPNYTWPANDARAWFHGNLIEQAKKTSRIFGHYELFFHIKSSAKLDQLYPPGVTFGGMVTPLRTWYGNQLENLKNAIGYYGVIDYMPANSVFGVLGDPGSDNKFSSPDDTDQKMSPEWIMPTIPGKSPNKLANNDDDVSWARGIAHLTRHTTYAVVPVSRYTPAGGSGWTSSSRVPLHYRSWSTDRSAKNQSNIADLTEKAGINRPLLEQHPSHWPELTQESMRYLTSSRFVTLMRVGWLSPLTGEKTHLSFTAISTTLRGARQQRQPSGGWSRPGAANLDNPTGIP